MLGHNLWHSLFEIRNGIECRIRYFNLLKYKRGYFVFLSFAFISSISSNNQQSTATLVNGQKKVLYTGCHFIDVVEWPTNRKLDKYICKVFLRWLFTHPHFLVLFSFLDALSIVLIWYSAISCDSIIIIRISSIWKKKIEKTKTKEKSESNTWDDNHKWQLWTSHTWIYCRDSEWPYCGGCVAIECHRCYVFT